MVKNRSRESRAEERAATIKKFHLSGLTQVAFCKEAGLPVSTLQNWLRTSSKVCGFAEVVPLRPPATTVELLFPDGSALRIRSE